MKPSAPMNSVREIRNFSETRSTASVCVSDTDWLAASTASNRRAQVRTDSDGRFIACDSLTRENTQPNCSLNQIMPRARFSISPPS